MTQLKIIAELLQKASIIPVEKRTAWYKTGPGEYAEHDQFIGVPWPALRKIEKEFQGLTLVEIETFLISPINEERLLALFILINQYQKADDYFKIEIYEFYSSHLRFVNNWNLVDASAHLIIGAHLLNADKSPLLGLARSNVMWERRVAIVATWAFIRENNLNWTFKVASILLHDSHELIHKAVGWMLREAGKRQQDTLILFLDKHAAQMPRTMLRYAIEKFSTHERRKFLAHGKTKDKV